LFHDGDRKGRGLSFMRVKVAFLTTDNREHFKDYSAPAPYFGTAPEAVLEGMKSLPDLEVHVMSCTMQRMAAPAQLGPNIFFHSLRVPKLGWLRTGYQGCIRAVRRQLREIQPDLVHGQGTERDCALNAVMSGFPNVLTLHGNMDHLCRLLKARKASYWWIAARLEDFTLKRTSGVFCNSSHTERLVGTRARRKWRVPNPVRKEFFAPLPQVAPKTVRPRLVNIGVISPYKRQLELLQVARELRREGHDFELLFVGHAAEANPYARAFLEQLKAVQPEGFIQHIQQKTARELRELFDESSALIHFAMEESFGLVVAEAVARNLKVITPAVGGVADIADGAAGVELLEKDDPETMKKTIARWLRAGCPRCEGGTELMRSRYSPEVVAVRHAQIYREVLERPL
jgi:glycosyltransferase involved in cell wall biosynthesis